MPFRRELFDGTLLSITVNVKLGSQTIGVMRCLDEIRNERIRGATKVGKIAKKVQGRRLKRHGHVMRREEHYIGRTYLDLGPHVPLGA